MSAHSPSQDSADELPAWLELLDHTADSGIIVRAADLPQLFARAAWGMFSLLTDPETVTPEHAETLAITASDREALLVRWLSELNFRHVTQRVVFSEFHILELNDQRLVARVAGEPIVPTRHVIHTEIKAVTFHGLRLEPKGDGWQAQIIFDL